METVYVQSARLNGARLERAWLTHDEITKGGTLELEMGARPDKKWGTPPPHVVPAAVGSERARAKPQIRQGGAP